MRSLLLSSFLSFGLILSGCATKQGPKLMQNQRYDYNEQFSRSQNEQMLLNIVRLRYGDMPLFLELNSIVTQYSIDNSLDLAAVSNIAYANDIKPSGSTTPSGSFGRSFSERPTISYTPLQGEDFAKRILSPIPPENIVLLSQSGWSISRLLTLSVKSINGIDNASSASGPTPDQKPAFEDFQALSRDLRKLQRAGLVATETEMDDGKAVTYLYLQNGSQVSGDLKQTVQRVKEKLGLNRDSSRYRIRNSSIIKNDSEVTLSTRSLLGVLFFLSQSVTPPEKHLEKKWAVVTKDSSGSVFDWSELLGPYLKVHSAKKKPDEDFVSVHYRNTWFYIEDSDINSKATFGLVNYLFALQAAEGEGRSPLLTISAGG